MMCTCIDNIEKKNKKTPLALMRLKMLSCAHAVCRRGRKPLRAVIDAAEACLRNSVK